MIRYLLSGDAAAAADAVDPLAGLDARLAALADAPRGAPFDDEVAGFVAALSRRLLTDPRFRAYPELMAMAHWFRAARLPALAARLPRDGVFAARGVVFHIAPSNVDSVFAYSWLLSVLCGNANVARVSRRRSPQMQAFFEVVDALLDDPARRALRARNLVLGYDRDATVTARLSAACQLRVVWGGDATVAQVRAVPLPPLAGELAFANRFSLAVLRARTVAGLDGKALDRLAEGFCNDAFKFDQQACASPRAMVWVGEPAACAAARECFWPAVEARLARRAADAGSDPIAAMDRATALFLLSARAGGAVATTPPGAFPTRLRIDDLAAEDRLRHDGHGVFLELDRPALADVAALLTSRDQTISHTGFAREEWLALLRRLPPHAADRIVPIGEALAFDVVWDGVDLLRAFTRELVLRA